MKLMLSVLGALVIAVGGLSVEAMHRKDVLAILKKSLVILMVNV